MAAQQRVGLFFGSFNPVHVGHLLIAETIADEQRLDAVWLVVSPHNPHKPKASLLDHFTRYALVEAATADNPRLRPSNLEFELPQPSYTVATLTHLAKAHPEVQPTLIMGADNLATLHKWKRHEALLEYPICVYPRPNAQPPQVQPPQLHRSEAPLLEISSSAIRARVQAGQSLRYWVPEPARLMMEREGLYR